MRAYEGLAWSTMITISVFGGADSPTVSELVSRTAAAADDGFDSIWFGQGFTVDTLTALAVALAARSPSSGWHGPSPSRDAIPCPWPNRP